MKILEAIGQVDRLKRNAYDRKDKVAWLSRVDQQVKTLIVDTHEGAETVIFDGYGEDTPGETVLLVPAPFDEMYLRFLEAQIAYHDGEEDRYNNAMELFNNIWDQFCKYYNRTHMPLGRRLKF